MSKNIFLTGATGQIGSFIARELLQQGHKLYLLVRGENPQQRVKQVFDKIGIKSSNYQIVAGDIQHYKLPDLNAKIDYFIHNAADLSFAEKDRSKVRKANINGTFNMLRWALLFNVKSFHYMSTAYVAGEYSQTFSEQDLDLGQTFRNPYEESKVTAEKLCMEFAKATLIPVAIYRPGIVMGEQNGTTLHYSGYYVFMKVMSALRRYQLKKTASDHNHKLHMPIRIEVNPNGKKHLVPVDFVAKSVAALMFSHHKLIETFFLLPETAPTNRETSDWLEKGLNISGLETVELGSLTQMTQLEKRIASSIEVYRPYLDQEPKFDTRYTFARLARLGIRPPQLGPEYFAKLIEYGEKDNWGRIQRKQTKTLPPRHPYFTEFLNRFVGEPILPDLERISSCFGISLGDDPENMWKLTIAKGILTTIEYLPKTTEVDFLYEVPIDIFATLISGERDPRDAFFAGQTEIIGNIEHGLRIARILVDFFTLRPYIADHVTTSVSL